LIISCSRAPDVIGDRDRLLVVEQILRFLRPAGYAETAFSRVVACGASRFSGYISARSWWRVVGDSGDVARRPSPAYAPKTPAGACCTRSWAIMSRRRDVSRAGFTSAREQQQKNSPLPCAMVGLIPNDRGSHHGQCGNCGQERQVGKASFRKDTRESLDLQ